MSGDPAPSTGAAYAARLQRLSGARWKRFVPNPYRWHLRAICRGQVLDVGCGIGRALAYVGGRGTGVDPNADAVAIARRRGLDAYTPDTFPEHLRRARFDTLLCSHVLEHVDADEATALLRTWLPAVRPGGKVVLICPQERGYASDPTHVRFLDHAALVDLCATLALVRTRRRSFPFPRVVGRWWSWNETVVTAAVPA